MKRLFFVVASFLILAVFFIPSVRAQSLNSACVTECIRSFATITNINADGTITVEEQIEYDFTTLQRHGIFRTIPFVKKNKEDKKFRLDFKNISVQDELGQPYQYKESTEGENINLKIGDPDRTISGVHTYIIRYTVAGALTYFSDHDELYWNNTGNEWEVPIMQATAKVILPKDVSAESLRMACYTGSSGSQATQCTTQSLANGATFSINQQLNQGEGLTTAVSFPKHIVAVLEPQEYKTFFETFLGKIVLLLIVLAALWWYLGYPVWLPIRWYLYGRDPFVGKPVTAWFDPPKTKKGMPLTPAEVGTLIDENAEPQDISAMIVNLAQRGYFRIVENKKDDFSFVKTKEFADDTTLLPFEQTFLDGVFAGKGEEVRLKDHDATIVSVVDTVSDQIYTHLVQEGFFPHNPKSVRNFYNVITGLAMFTFNLPLLLSSAIFGRVMPRKTLFGAQAANVARAVKNFLASQERQLEFQAKNQMFFEKLLPFAIAFGVETIWAKRFEDISMKPPTWYQGYAAGVYTPTNFTHSLNSSLSSFQRAATPTTSSSGFSSGSSGGSSGGGGGGGGGGSW